MQACWPGTHGCCSSKRNFNYRPKMEKNSTLYNIKVNMITHSLVEKMGLTKDKVGGGGVGARSWKNIPEAILKDLLEESQNSNRRGGGGSSNSRSMQVKKLMLQAKKGMFVSLLIIFGISA